MTAMKLCFIQSTFDRTQLNNFCRYLPALAAHKAQELARLNSNFLKVAFTFNISTNMNFI